MDYSFFIDKTSEILLENGFYKGMHSDLQQCYVKIQPPLLYAVHIYNSNNYTDNDLNLYLNQLKSNLKNFGCSNIVCLNICYSINNAYNIDDKLNFNDNISENIHYVYWIFDSDNERLLFPKGQPTKLNGIEKYFNWNEYEKSQAKYIKIYNNTPYFTYAVIVINIIIWAYINIKGGENFIYNFGTSRQGLVSGEIYRFITSVFIHQELSHLFFNCFSLYIFGRETERILSRYNFIGLYFITGFLASFFSALFNGNLAIGASGAIFGVIGALASVCRVKAYKAQLMDYFTLVLYMVISILMGFSDVGIDNTAHIFGALSGFLIQSLYFKFKYNGKNN